MFARIVVLLGSALAFPDISLAASAFAQASDARAPAKGTANEEDVDLLDDPAVAAAADVIKTRNTTVVEKIIQKTEVVCETQYRCGGLFGRRQRAVQVRREAVVSRVVSEKTVNLDDGVGWRLQGDIHLGHHTDNFPVTMLPAAAGARGTKINRAAAKVLGDLDAVDFTFGELDRVLVRTPKKIAGADTARVLVRVEALVGGVNDEKATITVKVQERDAAGNLVEDTNRLKAKAKKIWQDISEELKK